MKSSAQVVVIGGGVVGASVLYHLTKAGWTDVLLLERRELTAGSTWHAAGGMHTLNGDPNVARLQQYTIQLYESINHGYVQARQLKFITSPANAFFEWLRLPGDLLFILGGALPVLWLCWKGVRYRVAQVTLDEPEDVLFTEVTEPEPAPAGGERRA